MLEWLEASSLAVWLGTSPSVWAHPTVLTVHTAGTHNASVSLPGLAEPDAAAMRDAIRAQINPETL